MGMPRYVTGIPCKHGHLSPRATASGQCLQCQRERVRKAHAEDPSKGRLRAALWYQENKERKKEARRIRENKPVLILPEIPQEHTHLLDLPRTLKEARAKGLPTYFTGKPCRQGHWSFRTLHNGCEECRILRMRRRNADLKVYQ